MFKNGDKVKHKVTNQTGTFIGAVPSDTARSVVLFDHAYQAPLNTNIYAYAWYDDIPEGGVLCWVCDGKINEKLAIAIITGKHGQGFRSATQVNWYHATPLTKEEIKQFMDTCPDA